MELTNVITLLLSTTQAVEFVEIQLIFFQQQQIVILRQKTIKELISVMSQ